MLALLIIAALFALGFGFGYGVRDQVSRRRRYRHSRSDKSPHPKPQIDQSTVDPAVRALVMDLDSLLIATNDDPSRRRQRPPARQKIEQRDPLDQFDVAVQDLLVELGRDSSRSPAPVRRVQR